MTTMSLKLKRFAGVFLVLLALSSFASLLLANALYGSLPTGIGDSSSATWHRPELEYLKVLNGAGPPRDPQILFLLMGQYANANLHRDGIEFFSTVMKEFEPRLSDSQKSLYLAAIGLLRAGYANEVSFFSRIGWVRDTIQILEEAKRLSGDRFFPSDGYPESSMPSFRASSIRGKRR